MSEADRQQRSNGSSPDSGNAPAQRHKDARGLVIIPTYNEEAGIPSLLARLQKHVHGDMICVNDGSSDQTRSCLEQAGVTVLSHPINLGYAEALRSGIHYALEKGYDYCVFIDADGQHDPEEIDLLVHAIQERGADLVVGSRFMERTGYVSAAGRRVGMILFARLASLITRQRITDPTSGFKVLSRRAMAAMKGRVFADFHAELLVYLAGLGLKVVEVPIHVAPREHGSSMYDFAGAVRYPLITLLCMLVAFLEARVGTRSGGNE